VRISKSMPIAGALACGSMLVGQAGMAAPNAGVEEIIVTAQKRAENLQKVPVAVTAFTSQALENRGITNFEGIVNATPSLSTANYPSSTMLILYMRGQGVSDPGQITFDGAIGLYVDGFYIARPQGAGFDLGDIERVEVLRGPQGTLYGRNTTGGAVNIINKAPTGELGFKQSVSFGSRNMFRSKTSIDLPAWNDISTKLTLLKFSEDGYVKNTGSSHDYGEEGQLAGRFALNWKMTENFAADYFLERDNTDSTSLYYQNRSLEGMTILGHPYTGSGEPRSHTYRPIDLKPNDSRANGQPHNQVADRLSASELAFLPGLCRIVDRRFPAAHRQYGG
jgi:iron complex outermembrane receptor protein